MNSKKKGSFVVALVLCFALAMFPVGALADQIITIFEGDGTLGLALPVDSSLVTDEPLPEGGLILDSGVILDSGIVLDSMLARDDGIVVEQDGFLNDGVIADSKIVTDSEATVENGMLPNQGTPPVIIGGEVPTTLPAPMETAKRTEPKVPSPVENSFNPRARFALPEARVAGEEVSLVIGTTETKHATLEAAVAAANGDTTGGAIVITINESISFNTELFISKPLTLQGKAGATLNVGALGSIGINAANVTVKNLTITSASSQPSLFEIGPSGSGATLDHLIINASGTAPIALVNGTNAKLTNLTVTAAAAISSPLFDIGAGGAGAVADNLDIRINGMSPLAQIAAPNVTIRNSTVMTSTNPLAYLVKASASGFLFEQNTVILGGPVSHVAQGTAAFTLSENKITVGGAVSDLVQSTAGVTVQKNIVIVNSTLDKLMQSTSSFSFTDNTVTCGQNGTVPVAFNRSGTITNNQFIGVGALATVTGAEPAGTYNFANNFFDLDKNGVGEIPVVLDSNSRPYVGPAVKIFPYHKDANKTPVTAQEVSGNVTAAINALPAPTDSAVLTQDQINSILLQRGLVVSIPEVAAKVSRDNIYKLSALYQKAVPTAAVTITDNSSVLDGTKITVAGAALYAQAGEIVVLTITDTTVTVPTAYESKNVAVNLTLTKNGTAVVPHTPVGITMPLPTGIPEARLTVLHYTAPTTMNAIAPYNFKTENSTRLFTFDTGSFSTFAFANKKAPAGNSGGGDTNDAAKESFAYWDGIREEIESAYAGETIYAKVTDDKNVPVFVLQALKGKKATLEIDYSGGTIVIDGKKMHPISDSRIYYPATDLAKLYSKPVEPPKPEKPPYVPPTYESPVAPPPSSSEEESTSSSEPEESSSEPEEPEEEQVIEPDVEPTPEPEKGMNLWLILGISAAVLAVVAVVVCVVLVRRRREDDL